MRVLSATFVLVLAATVTGFAASASPGGEAARTIPQILRDVLAAADGARSVHIVGSGSSGGTSLALDLRLTAGRGGEGTIEENGLSFRIVRIGDKAYFEGAAAFWRHFAGAGGAQLFNGKWIEASATSGQLASLSSLTSISTLFRQLLGAHGTLVQGKPTVIRGEPALALVDTTQGGTLYVAARGVPYPLELRPPGGKGSIGFEGWNQPFSLKTPPRAIALSSIKG